MTNLLTLAQQIEQANEDQQAEMLVSAWMAITPDFSAEWSSRANPFLSMLNAKAYESAAMMLVPKDRRLLCLADLSGGQWAAKLWKMPTCGGATAALALAAACCRAVAQMKSEADPSWLKNSDWETLYGPEGNG